MIGWHWKKNEHGLKKGDSVEESKKGVPEKVIFEVIFRKKGPKKDFNF